MLNAPHVAPLTDFVASLREQHPNWEFPDFDPRDGGTNADVLFLFEKPGPMTSTRAKGSGFISRDNDDPTAEATFNFMQDANLSRERTVLWNVVPGWNGTRKITATELRAGINSLKTLVRLLPKLSTIVFVGKKAQRAQRLVSDLDLQVELLDSPHPSPIVRASRHKQWLSIPSIWSRAAQSGALHQR